MFTCIASIALLSGAFCSDEADTPAETPVQLDGGLPNPSSRPQIDSRYVDFFANILVWHPTETLDWAETLEPGETFTSTFNDLTFDWEPGFRVGFGYNMEHDQWDTQFYYTRFQIVSTDHSETSTGVIKPGLFGAKFTLPNVTRGKISWNLNFNIFDWEIGRSFYASRALSLRPYIGLKGGWINQRIHTYWENPDYDFLGFSILVTGKEKVTNNFRGGGPKGGVNAKWILGHVKRCQFSLVGDFGAAYMWGNWTIRDNFIDSLGTQFITKVGDRNFGAFMLQSLMGLGFDFNFDKDRAHFAIKLAYEIQDWFNQLQVFSDASGTGNNDLLLQGATLDLHLDF